VLICHQQTHDLVAHSRCPHICEMRQCAQATFWSPRALMWGLRPPEIPTIPHLTWAEPNPGSRFPTALDQPLSRVQQRCIEVYADHSSQSLNAWTKGTRARALAIYIVLSVPLVTRNPFRITSQSCRKPWISYFSIFSSQIRPENQCWIVKIERIVTRLP
jgi:hypothetical protein